MTAQERQPPARQAVIRRFVAACRADARVVAAFLGGSLARDTADAYSDLDLYLVTTDAGYDAFFAGRAAFIRLLGDPVFLEDYKQYGFDLLFFVLADGTEGELGLGRASHFHHIHGGPHRTLLDKQGLLAGVVFPEDRPDQAAQLETLRGLITWFWHDLSHFIAALGRGQVWAAQGALEDLRRTCVNLARLRHNFAAPAEGYEKLERALPVEQLAPLQPTFGSLAPETLLQAAHAVVRFYRELAPPLARAHGLPYPDDLDRVLSARLENLSRSSPGPAEDSSGG
jgi:hypothetical protein